jgi:sec-independent protein translocase protein TatB
MLPDFGWTELLVIAIVLIVVVGPKDLPKMLRTFGKTTSNLRKMAGDFRKQFDDALKEAELDDVRNIARDLKGLDPRNEIKETLRPLGKIGEDLNADLKKAAADIDKTDKPKSATQKALDGSGDKMRAAQAKTDKSSATNRKAAAGDAKRSSASATKAKAASTKPATTTAKPAPAKPKSGGSPTGGKTVTAKPAAKNAVPAAAKTKAPPVKTAAAAKSKAKTASTGGKS